MKDRLLIFVLVGAAALAGWAILSNSAPPPEPKAPAKPAPVPQPPCPGPNCPRPKPRPWGKRFPLPVGSFVSASINGEVGPDGTELQCPLPAEFHTKNTGGSDGAGLCVFCSMKHAGIWQDDPVFAGLFDWMKHHPGGGYPAKVDRMIEQFCREKNLPKPDYIQVEGTDLEILQTACRSGRMPAVTYSFSPTGRYGGHRIAHMVNLVHADAKHFVILDRCEAFCDSRQQLPRHRQLRMALTGGIPEDLHRRPLRLGDHPPAAWPTPAPAQLRWLGG